MILRKLILPFTAAVLLAGCNLEEINENPNVPVDVPLSTLLPPAQKALADAQGGRIFRYTGIFAQQLRGTEAQELLVENYQPDEAFIGNPWADIYLNSLINLHIIIERADGESPHYAGVARILMAHGLGLLTDIWGDVPYSEAFRGGTIAHPVFDSQQSIYQQIFNLLEQGIEDLQAQTSVFSPGVDDRMYGGNRTSWIKAARVMQARYQMRLLKLNPNAATDVLNTFAQGGYTSADLDLQYTYFGTGDDTNPLSRFFQNTPYTDIDQQFRDLTQGISDPRYNIITRLIPFSGGLRRPGDFYAGPTAPVKLASYLEQLFLTAEARYRNGDIDGAREALEEAVLYHMNAVSVGATTPITPQLAADYITAQVQITGNFGEDIRVIMTQKYIAMFTTPEPWADWRRTGWPQLSPNTVGPTDGNPNGEIPRRLLYPQSERLRNNNFPQPAPNMQTRMWWDVQ